MQLKFVPQGPINNNLAMVQIAILVQAMVQIAILVQNCSIFIASVLKRLQSCTKPLR